jgi:hypothetical protein
MDPQDTQNCPCKPSETLLSYPSVSRTRVLMLRCVPVCVRAAVLASPGLVVAACQCPEGLQHCGPAHCSRQAVAICGA